MLICPRLPCFLRGERKNTATPCRKISYAMRLEGCKEIFLVAADKSVIFCQNSTNFAFLMFHHRRNSRSVFLK